MARRINFDSVSYRPPPVRNRGEIRNNEQQSPAPERETRTNRPYNRYRYMGAAYIPEEQSFWDNVKNRYREIDDSLNTFFDNIEYAVDEWDDKINEGIDTFFDSLKFWRR